ncbi:esterase-like activity of phytase family protein [Sphingobium algorifonticola]|uniref:Esterase-like activity of phytase family protein n=1 Tax=Sphingobium algorifonticola TaxID=2008318 RepID=A0A437J9U4_9SPHN|nr:esterase-like activity of phytase family protein [Sphingobium algorifonticola]RVT42153.1 esterase-like activity of phytase family protein [Sphingobium algorifonticola]
MSRIALILLLAVALLSPPPPNKSGPRVAGLIAVTAQPLALDSSDPARTLLGPLRYLGGWALRSDHDDFGGISSLRAMPDGSLLALSDSGMLLGFTPGKARGFIAPLPVFRAERNWPGWKWDSEAQAYDPATGRYWVSFELIQRVCRYAPGYARVEACRVWPAVAAWPDTGGGEAMARLPDGRFLLFSEYAYGPGGVGTDVLLFQQDPADRSSVPPLRLSYRPPQGYRATDAVALDHDRLLVLNRRVTLHEGFTAVLSLVKLPPLRAGAVLVPRDIARFAPPLLADNFEALALSRENGRRILWIASDDNHQFFQRSLLLKFALPDDPGQ